MSVKNQELVLTKKEALCISKLSNSTFSRYRNSGKLLKDIHFVKPNSRLIRYYQDTLTEWVNTYGYDTARQLSESNLPRVVSYRNSQNSGIST